ncbi:MAG: hypothetical protein RL557_946 [archaeon]|jgi:hypothetical protein
MIETRINDQVSQQYANLLLTRLRKLTESGLYVFPSDNNICVAVDGFEKRDSNTIQIRPCSSDYSLQLIYLHSQEQTSRLISLHKKDTLTTCVIADSKGEKSRFEISDTPFSDGRLITYDNRTIGWADYIPRNVMAYLREK